MFMEIPVEPVTELHMFIYVFIVVKFCKLLRVQLGKLSVPVYGL